MEHENKKNNLTAQDICNIIKSAKKSGLLKLSFGDLNLEFSETTAAIVGLHKDTALRNIKDIQQLSLGTPEELGSPDREEIVDDVEDMHLAVSDPAAWEKKHLEGNTDAAETGHNET